MTAENDTQPPIEFDVYVALDSLGAFAACTENDDLTAAFEGLTAGYRLIRLRLTAMPPDDTKINVEVPDAAPGEAKASVAP